MSSFETLPPLREVIARHGLSARKRLGQNFILDLNVTTRIAREAGDLTQSDVLEIGPGPGGLTRALLAAGARRILAVEKDARCLPALQEIAATCPGRLHILNADALDLDLSALLDPPVRIVSNLPYNVGTALLIRWLTPLDWPPFWQSLTLMFQREVATRIVGRPGSKAYGRLAILAQWRAEARVAMSLKASVFTPPPKVSSSVVHLTALPRPKFPAHPETLSRVVAAAFTQRRKMLRKALGELDPDIGEILRKTGIDPCVRADQVSIKAYCALARALDKT